MKQVNWNLWFYIPFFLSLAAGGAIVFTIEKGNDVLFVNGFHSIFLDNLFYYGTELGNGILYLIVVIALLWKNVRNAIIALSCFALSGILVQFLKKIIFNEMMRPGVMLTNENLHFVEGVKILKYFSFPSGHTAMAFSLFCLLSQFVRPRWIGLAFIFMACIGGISRIYLVQHFSVDVFFGAILGVGVTSFVWFVFSKKAVLTHLDKRPLLSYLIK